ncbi:alpha/beta hydrolase [Maribacter sp. ACAM166]|uniref:alpha/beta hydrolase n=1 Tax=Maribacter sp. ACAM166 TaxID=2508996 RepID=UPI0010FD58D0|nr:alpha/beta fold hydrolase [Maribacter sp. ACAM166]TLP71902.1 alpha/beta hydrolase [Maribacter sp. ACAM166]
MKLVKTILIILITISCSSQVTSNNHANNSNIQGTKDKEMSFKKIEFPSVGVMLRGRLYLPENNTVEHPLVIMAHGFSATINGMVADKYAEEFCKAGFTVLLYDHRNFGISEGTPRQELNYWVQCRGYIDAINFAYTLSTIDNNKITLWGDSISSAEALTVAAVDERAKAIIGQVPAFGDVQVPFEKSDEMMKSIKGLLLNEHLEDLEREETSTMAVVSPNQDNMNSALKELTAYRWFIEYGGRFDTKWQNSVSFSTFKNAPKNYHRGIAATLIKAPILLVVAKNDEMEGASARIAKSVFEKISQPKKLVYLDGGHFGLLEYPSDLFNEASKAQVDFLKTLFNN